MTLVIPFWVIPAILSLLVIAVANWWPDDSTGYGAAAVGIVRLVIVLALVGGMWIGILVWRLNS